MLTVPVYLKVTMTYIYVLTHLYQHQMFIDQLSYELLVIQSTIVIQIMKQC